MRSSLSNVILDNTEPTAFYISPSWITHGRIPFLDGLRAVAIFMVIVSHLSPQMHMPGFTKYFNGHIGVTLFFVISGFLITLLMLREHEKTGTVSLKAFYTRRILRIFPAYYAYMGVGAILWLLRVIQFPKFYWGGR